MYYDYLKKLLFLLPPEAAHYFTLNSLNLAHQLGILKKVKVEHEVDPITVMGLKFPNRVGLAAGLDKNGEYIEALSCLGFGFIEVGTVTPLPQTGNPKPRLFRLEDEQAIINRLGFNNKGLDFLVSKLEKTKYTGILGINVGKNKDTPLEKATDDYCLGFNRVAKYASYVTINISSPNTESLRQLQHGELLKNLLLELKKAQATIAKTEKYVPLVIKIAPDLTENEIKEVAFAFLETKIDGVIATNTTLSRETIAGHPLAKETGGLSGKPLFIKSTQTLKQLHSYLENQIPIIGCGGILDAKSAKEKIFAGATLIQIYSSLIYGGPGIIPEIVGAIKNFKNFSETAMSRKHT